MIETLGWGYSNEDFLIGLELDFYKHKVLSLDGDILGSWSDFKDFSIDRNFLALRELPYVSITVGYLLDNEGNEPLGFICQHF